MITFRTEINPPPSALRRISHETKIMFSGSCFTENIGSFLEEHLFPVKINPFGVVYNPVSLLNTLGILLDDDTFTEEDLSFGNEKWFSWDHHTSFSDPDRDRCLSMINKEILDSSSHLRESGYLLITFGTAWVFRLKETGKIVTNCHKLPDAKFERFMLKKEDIVMAWTNFLDELFTVNPNIKVIFTVSPVRHWKDGAHGNQISKAVLLLAVDEICKNYPGATEYFPAYELLLDDLRDYRFYADDLLHPSSQAIQYILEKFSLAYFDENTNGLIREIHKLVLAKNHRVYNPDSEAHKKFIASQQEIIRNLSSAYPYLDLRRFESVFLAGD